MNVMVKAFVICDISLVPAIKILQTYHFEVPPRITITISSY